MLLLVGNLYSVACQSTYIASPWHFVYWQYASYSKRAVIKWVFQGTHTCHSLKNWAQIHIHVCVSCLVMYDSETAYTEAHQAPPSMGSSRQEDEWVAISFSIHIHGYLLISCCTEQSGNLPDFKLKWHNFYFSIGGMSKNLWSFSIIINTVQ